MLGSSHIRLILQEAIFSPVLRGAFPNKERDKYSSQEKLYIEYFLAYLN